MGRVFLITVVLSAGLSIAPALESETGPNFCEALQEPSDSAAMPVAPELPSEGVVSRDDRKAACFAIGEPAASGFTREALRGIESEFPDLRRSKEINLSESAIRVYDADGNQYQERKIRFGLLPREFMLDLQRRAEKTEARSAIDCGAEPLQHAADFCKPLTDPLLYAPILVDPGLRQPIPCQP